jgi:hypothetical protein
MRFEQKFGTVSLAWFYRVKMKVMVQRLIGFLVEQVAMMLPAGVRVCARWAQAKEKKGKAQCQMMLINASKA